MVSFVGSRCRWLSLRKCCPWWIPLGVMTCLSLLTGPALGVTRLNALVVGAGGGHLVGSRTDLRCTVGQPFAGTVTGATVSLDLGFWRLGFLPVSAVVSERTPVHFRLLQNVPNPFNPVTTISYDLPVPVPRVRLRIYDLRGRLVKTLTDDHQMAGVKSVVWNGRDDHGGAVASGAYFYVLEAG